MTTTAATANASSPQAMGEKALPVTTATFMKEVLEASLTQLVIVDFWANWCEPCRQLGPVLERTVASAGGAAKLVKIDIEECPQIAQQMRIQSIPAVFAFFKKQVVDGFMGSQPESQIKAWLDELIKATGVKPQGAQGEDYAPALAQAAELMEVGDVATAHAIYADILDESPSNEDALAGLVRCLIAEGNLAEARALLDQAMSGEMKKSKTLPQLLTSLELAEAGAGAQGNDSALRKALEANANDHQARFDLALALYGQGKAEEAFDELLEIVRRDRKWNDEAARKQLVKLFEALGPTHELTIQGRKRLSSILFA